MVFAEWQVGQVLWSMLWFTMFFLWIWVVITVFADIFRSHDMGGMAKALWTLFVIFLPVAGVLAYLIVRGHKIGEHRVADVQRADAEMQSYIRTAAASPVSDLATLADLHDRGVIDDTEFAAMKQRSVAS
ncbi:MAG TPA: SHOCT domain-containing protein [Acidimicrobiales bacterium]|jgi:hypothetical protein|nr:SHOCT domain-containing protein [Acidimicrobiales bacterium]